MHHGLSLARAECHPYPGTVILPARAGSGYAGRSMGRADDNGHTSGYPLPEKTMRWSDAKNDALRAGRGITFEEIVVAVGTGGLLDVLPHPRPESYPGQRVLVVAIGGYAYLVPFVEDVDHLFLKTAIPSRKATRDYLGGTADDRA